MKLVIIIGPQAVGKMTVGRELEKITGLKLFHNHMTIELVSPFFNYESKIGRKLVKLFRKKIFEEVSKSNLAGLIFTYVWLFDQKTDKEYIESVCDIFKSKGGEIYFVELKTNLAKRIERNRHPYRLKYKVTKRNIKDSEDNLKKYVKKHRLYSKEGEFKGKNYIRINNTNLSPIKTAQKVKDRFKL